MNRQIETLRGFACVLLVLYHVIGAVRPMGCGSPKGRFAC